MRILIFSHKSTGHYTEYIHHLYERFQEDSHNDYFILMPPDFELIKKKYEWADSPNIHFLYLSDSERQRIEGVNLIKGALYMSLILRRYVDELNINKVFLLWFIGLMPFLPLLLKRKVHIMGILYRIHFYMTKDSSKFSKSLDNLRMRVIASFKNVDTIFVLNDEQSTERLNLQYKTTKFKYLPDPVPRIDNTKVKNLRSDLRINDKKRVYLHFGAMDERKGTLSILKAISESEKGLLNDSVFIFAGRINAIIENEFWKLYEKASKKAEIRVYNEFCENEFLYNLCFSCDCILIPYTNTCQSSGVIGYASYFEKPVAGPSDGLLGILIKKYELGYCLDNVTSNELVDFFKRRNLPICRTEYSKTHTVDSFSDTIFPHLIKK